jgi:hypothetical protein
MAEETHEKRGPIEKGEKGWPINPVGLIAVLILLGIIGFLIIKPLLSPKSPSSTNYNPGGNITSPKNGDIIKGPVLPITLLPDNQANVQKVQFFVKTYADGKWQMVGEDESAPYTLEWSIPADTQNKAIAVTTHIFTKDGKEITDPGGWREGVILLSQ